MTFGQWTELSVVNNSANSGAITVNNETSSRALSTGSSSNVYQNTTGCAMLVVASITMNTQAVVVTGYSDSTTTPTAVTYAVGAGYSSGQTVVYMMVPNNHYYRIQCASGSNSISNWTEYTLPFNATKSAPLANAPAQRAQALGSGVDTPTTFTGPVYYTLKDLFVIACDTAGSTSTTIGEANNCFMPIQSPNATVMALSNVSSNWGSFILAMAGEFYWMAHDTTSSHALTVWWEYLPGIALTTPSPSATNYQSRAPGRGNFSYLGIWK